MASQNEDPIEVHPEDLWDIIFPFPNAYDAQSEGIRELIKTSTHEDGGYTVLEGACGTGKTLLSVVAGISLVRSPMTDFNRIFITTSVKQQLEAFEDDLEAVNEHLRELDPSQFDMPDELLDPITALSLVGKKDVCPFKYSGHIDPDYIYQNCSDLMDRTDDMINYYDDKMDKASAAEKLAADAQLAQGSDPEKSLDVEDPDTHPYPDTPPQLSGKTYCPYYAQWRLDDITDNKPIKYTGSVLTPQRLTERALQQGTCPHAAMKEIAPDAEVIIGNYVHMLQPQTVRAFTRHLMGNDTFLICDEAHTIVSKARRMFSKSVTLTGLNRSCEQIQQVIDWANKGPVEASETVGDALSRAKLSPTDLQEFKRLIEFTIDRAEKSIPDNFSRADTSAKELRNYGDSLEYSEHVPLRDPEEPAPDDISLQYVYSEFGDREPPIASLGGQVGNAIREAFHEVANELPDVDIPTEVYAETVGPFIQQYYLQNHRDYFREAEIIPPDDFRAPFGNGAPEHQLDIPQPVLLSVKNCVPAGKLSNSFDNFGSGVCMSATIAPQWIYRGETGLNYLDHEITELQYGLQFPEENRATYAVDLKKFTSRNRETKWANSQEEKKSIQRLRDNYYEAIKAVVSETPGNVLVAGPSYDEGEWAADRLEKDPDITKEVLLDTSSSNEATNKLREDFIDGPPKVLTTGMLGTLTEGVDFDGDALKAVAVFGIPIPYLGDPVSDATQIAYSDLFSESGDSNAGFQYAHGIPAIRKARQAIGRVIRSGSDVGVRVLIDSRYCSGPFHSHLSESERDELDVVSHRSLAGEVSQFWSDR